MKPRRVFGPSPHVRYRPELTSCPHCKTPLAYSQPAWTKAIQSPERIAQVISPGFRCLNETCFFPQTVYRSARGSAPAEGFRPRAGRGRPHPALRISQHHTREEIWRHLREHTPVQISERHGHNLLEVSLALTRASHADLRERLAAVVAEHGGLIVALDGLQPEQGNEPLWVAREVLSGAVLGAPAGRGRRARPS